MSWGDAFSRAYDAAGAAARAAADQAMSSARDAADAVARQAQRTAEAGMRAAQAAKVTAVAGAIAAKDTAVVGAMAVKDGAIATASAFQQGAEAVGKGAGNVSNFALRTAKEVGRVDESHAVGLVRESYRAAKQLLSASTVISPCPESWAAKKSRLDKRNQLVKDGRSSPRPTERAAAERLARNNESVELARLSEDSYAQFPGNDFHYPDGKKAPPAGWSIVSAAELEAEDVSVQDLQDARAVVYRTVPDWPGGQRTVLAFRGTADLDDGLVDHDQAMALSTAQYESAMVVGQSISLAYGKETVVTGHSLGGGKAQAAGVAGGLKGTMFNSAGLNPETVGQRVPDPSRFTQYRTSGDPLTGAQNSGAAQTVIASVAGLVAMPLGAGAKIGDAAQKALGFDGLSPDMADYADKASKAFPRAMKNLVKHGEVLPPALGQIREVPAINAQGDQISKLNPMGQHSITSVVNGIEQQKSEDLASLSA